MILTFTNKYVRNGYRHFLGKVQVFYKNFELYLKFKLPGELMLLDFLEKTFQLLKFFYQ